MATKDIRDFYEELGVLLAMKEALMYIRDYFEISPAEFTSERILEIIDSICAMNITSYTPAMLRISKSIRGG